MQDLAKKISICIALAPVAHVNHQRGFLLNLVAKLGADKVFQALGVKRFLTAGFITRFAPYICNILPR
jgi:hypothetical protein